MIMDNNMKNTIDIHFEDDKKVSDSLSQSEGQDDK